MEYVQAAKVLADQLEQSLSHEYFMSEAQAKPVAEAMSVVTGKAWQVKENERGFWLVRQ